MAEWHETAVILYMYLMFRHEIWSRQQLEAEQQGNVGQ